MPDGAYAYRLQCCDLAACCQRCDQLLAKASKHCLPQELKEATVSRHVTCSSSRNLCSAKQMPLNRRAFFQPILCFVSSRALGERKVPDSLAADCDSGHFLALQQTPRNFGPWALWSSTYDNGTVMLSWVVRPSYIGCKQLSHFKLPWLSQVLPLIQTGVAQPCSAALLLVSG